MDFLLAGLGLVILVLAGDSLVKGAVNLSLRVGIPALIVSLTIVAFGTSAPELLISIAAVKDGAPGLALGNVVGSNTANILLVLGIPALLAGLHTADCDTRRSYVQMIAATFLFIAVCFLGPITWIHGLVLLGALGWMLWDAFREAKAHKDAQEDDEEEVEGADPDMPWWKIITFLLLGLVGLPLGRSSPTSLNRPPSAVYTPYPPVSTTSTSFGSSVLSGPKSSTTAATRSLVTPGVGSTIDTRSFARRFIREDFPTFGRPTIARRGMLITASLGGFHSKNWQLWLSGGRLRELPLRQPLVESIPPQQLVVPPDIHNLALVHHDDAVRARHRRQPVGHDQARPPRRKGV